MHDNYRNININAFHVHFINKEDERFIPIRVQIARFHARLLFLSNSFSLENENRNRNCYEISKDLVGMINISKLRSHMFLDFKAYLIIKQFDLHVWI